MTINNHNFIPYCVEFRYRNKKPELKLIESPDTFFDISNLKNQKVLFMIPHFFDNKEMAEQFYIDWNKA